MKPVKVSKIHKSAGVSRKDRKEISGLVALQHLEIMVNRLHLEIMVNHLHLEITVNRLHLEIMVNHLLLDPMGSHLDLQLMDNRLGRDILEVTKGVLVMVETTDRVQRLHMEGITCKGFLVSILAQVKDNKGTGRVGSKDLMRSSFT
uniref:Uncharacterized protein n=1 Tax=Aegilops tauschii subsp. strangulata TaxID=200361 RepID=A0A453HL66_AEGTS